MRNANRLRPFVALACALPLLAAAEPIRRAQHPAVSPDGLTLVFSWQGDLWRVPVAGGRAERLTVHPALDTRPVWFADGHRLAFASNRFGSLDVFTMRPDGSDLRRVTFDSATEYPTAASPDGKHLYGATTAFGRQDLFRVASNGGDLVRLTDHPLEAKFLASLSPDGSKVYYNRGAYGSTAWQKPGVVSTALPEIWVADNTVPLANHRRLTENERTDLWPRTASDGSITYVSNASGWPNIWRMRPDGSAAKALTTHLDGTCHDPSVSQDGQTVVYVYNSVLYRLDAKSGATQPIDVDLPADARNNPLADLTLTTGVTDYATSPDGKRAVVAVRGDLFLIPEKGGTTRRLTTNPGLDQHPAWLDAKTMLYTASKEGLRELASVTVDGQVKTFLSGPKHLTHPSPSPDGKTIAFHRGDDEIAVVPAGGGEAKPVLRGDFMGALAGSAAFSWSPDGKWIAAAVQEGRRVNIMLANVESGRQIVAARLASRPQSGGTSTPRWLPNGRGIAFTSSEYEESDLFVVDLVPNEIAFTEDDLDKLDEPKKEEKKDVTVEVVEDGLDYRLRRLTTTGAFGFLPAPDGRSIYTNLRSPVGPSQLSSIPVSGGPASPVSAVAGAAGSLEASRDGKRVYFVSAGRLNGWTIGTPAASPIPFSAQFTVDLKAEERALFLETAWAMENLYYDPKLHGKNWPDIRRRYEALLPYTTSRTDFYDLLDEMMEELDSSHLGATSPPEDPPTSTPDQTGFLGVEFDPKALDARGVYRVASVLPQSPAAEPASRLLVGDRIVSIDGAVPGPGRPLAALLNRKAGKRVVLAIERNDKALTVAIKPAASALRGELLYEDWVATQRRLTDRYSGGRLAYAHIRSMNQSSLDRFLREIRTQTEGKQGLIVDVRYNGGGSTAVQVLNILKRETWLVRTTRGEFGARLSENLWRSDALEMPSALLANSYSFSNAEIMAEGFRQMKLGPFVGERTPGYVIGTSGYGLWDGGSIRMPASGAYTVQGENLENNGRRPDHAVWFDPNAWSKGEDLQLRRAVEALIKR